MEITVRANELRFRCFSEICELLKLRRDPYINARLPDELEIVERLPRSDDEGRRYERSLALASDKYQKNITLDIEDSVAQRVSSVCAEKNIPRNAFFDAFIWFLCVRLIRPAIIVSNPRASLAYSEEEFNKRVQAYLIADRFEIDGTLYPDYYESELVWTKERVENTRRLMAEVRKDLRKSAIRSHSIKT